MHQQGQLPVDSPSHPTSEAIMHAPSRPTRRPLGSAALSAGGGMACAAFVGTGSIEAAFSFPIVIISTIVILAMMVVAARFGLFAHRPQRNKLWVSSLLFLIGFSYYLGYDGQNQSELKPMLFSGEAEEELSWTGHMRGMIANPPVVDGDRLQFDLQVSTIQQQNEWASVQREKVRVSIRLESEKEQEQARHWERGETIQTLLTITLPDSPSNPAAFDYPRYLRHHHIHLVGKGTGLSSVVREKKPKWGLVWTDRWRQLLDSKIEEIFLPQSTPIFKGLLIGDKSDISWEIDRLFSTLGLSHILAISGSHVVVVTGVIIGSLLLAGLTRESALKWVLYFLPFYAILTGLTPSVIRACLMASLALIAILVRRKADGWNIIGLALLVMIFINPYYLWDVGFQLSFAVTAGLILFVSPLYKMLPLPAKARRLRGLLAVSLAAQLVSFPFMIFYFHQYSLLSLIANLFAVPLLAGLMVPAGMISLLFGLLHPAVPHLVVLGLDEMWQGIMVLLQAMGEQRWFHLSWATPPWWWFALYGCAMFVLWIALSRLRSPEPNDKVLLAVMLGLLILIWYAHDPWPEQQGVTITFLDVGQGDAAVVELPGEKTLLIDAGGVPFWMQQGEEWEVRHKPFDPGRDIVVPFLRYRGISRVDTVIMSHGDEDHIGGMMAVLSELPVGKVIGNGGRPESERETEIIDWVKNREIPLYRAEAGASWRSTPGVSWRVLWPDAEHSPLLNKDNDRSVVLLLTAYGRNIMFVGDLERAGEEEVRKLWNRQYPSLPLDMLKVGHHGSDTSTSAEWLEWLHPQYAVISAGRNNRYGHPSLQVLERLAGAGTTILRTDTEGAVTVRITEDGDMKVRTVGGERVQLLPRQDRLHR